MPSDETQLESELLIPPKQAAERLGVSASGLRRLATLWEEVYGPIHWGGERESGGRVYPERIVERLEAARALVRKGQSKSIQNALQALEDGATPPAQTLARPGVPDQQLFEALLIELRTVREELGQLRTENADMARRLPPPGGEGDVAAEVRALREQVERLAAPPRQSERVGDGGGAEAGLLVRLATRLEGLWRGTRGRS